MRWSDVYSGDNFGITPRSSVADARTPRVQSYGDVIARYRTHSEAKNLGPDGMPCGRQTVRLLQRRPVTPGEVVYVGKETNRLEEVEAGAIHDWKEVQLAVREPGGAGSRSEAVTLACSSRDRQCRQCGAMLTDTRRLYCSAACRQRAYRGRQPQAPSRTSTTSQTILMPPAE